MSEIKRFELIPSDDECFLEEDVCCDGSLVDYGDHKEVVDDLERRLEEAREETANLKLIIKDVIKSCREHKLNNTADEIERQLKEKGE